MLPQAILVRRGVSTASIRDAVVVGLTRARLAVTLTVTDSHGASASCTATVTVVDQLRR